MIRDDGDTQMEPFLRLEDSAGNQLAFDNTSGSASARIIYGCDRTETSRVIATIRYSAGPESLASRVSLAVQEVVIMLAHEVVRIINGVRRRLRHIIRNRHGGRRRRSEHCATSQIRKRDWERL